MTHKVDPTMPANEPPSQRKPWSRPSLQLLSASAASGGKGGTSDGTFCPDNANKGTPCTS